MYLNWIKVWSSACVLCVLRFRFVGELCQWRMKLRGKLVKVRILI